MKDKKTLIVIIVLLGLTLPLGLVGTIKHFSIPQKEEVPENLEQKFIYQDNVYFYLEGSLLGTYECLNCALPETSVMEDEYHTNSYKGGQEELEPVVNSFYAIFKKGDKQVLYSIIGKRILAEYKSIKTYNTKANNMFVINETSAGYGVTFFELGKSSIPSEYDYIALPGHFEDGLLDATKFIVKKNNLWFILKEDKTSLNDAVSEEIVDFNDNYYITYDSGEYKIYDYDGNLHENILPKTNVYGVGKYLFIVNNRDLYIYEDIDDELVDYKNVGEYKEISFNKKSDGIEVIIDGKISETLALS